MGKLRILAWAAAVASFALANRVEAQVMFGGSVRYSSSIGYAAGPFGSVARVRGPFGGSVTSVGGPFGGRVTVAQGPFGGGAVGVRGPFGGAVAVASSPIVPVVPPVSVNVIQQTVLNPAPAPMPYSQAYLRRIPPDLPTLQLGGVNYLYTPVLPPGSQPTTVGGEDYFASNGVNYKPYFLGIRTVYLVVEL